MKHTVLPKPKAYQNQFETPVVLSPNEKGATMIDWARVDELRTDLGAEDFDEITALFLEEVEGRLETLMDSQGVRLVEDLHFLKGSAANLGFAEMRRVCECSETNLERCNPTKVIDW